MIGRFIDEWAESIGVVLLALTVLAIRLLA